MARAPALLLLLAVASVIASVSVFNVYGHHPSHTGVNGLVGGLMVLASAALLAAVYLLKKR